MHVIGTAGHVDHGKSTLVTAITGINPDRLKEEQEREMTIELGFSLFSLPDGEEVGVVDVPGHRDFINHMLAGVGGIDAVLFVVAADEGVMPQTREHLAILDLLQVPAGIIVLNKVDLIDDPDWLDLVEMDIREAVAGSVLESASLVRVSARTGVGIDNLIGKISECLKGQPNRPDLGRPRLSVDRVFTVAGFGTVVTGTLLDGCLGSGDEVEILPSGKKARIRSLQTYKKKQSRVMPGTRTAVNLSGIDVDQIQRGDVVAAIGTYQTTRRIDVHCKLLPDVANPLTHNSEIKFYLGTTEVMGRVRLLGQEVLSGGESGWLQLELKEPIVAARGDHYILRRPSPEETLGGGRIVDPQPPSRHKRFDSTILDHLMVLEEGEPTDVFFRALAGMDITFFSEVVARSRLSNDVAQQAAGELIQSGLILQLDERKGNLIAETLLTSSSFWKKLTDQAINELSKFHQTYPLRRGMPREALKSRLKLQPRPFQAAVNRWEQVGQMVENGARVALSDFQVVFTPDQQTRVDQLISRFVKNPFSPPTLKECQSEIGEELFSVLLEEGIFISVNPEVVFLKKDYEILLDWVRQYLLKNKTLTVAEFRDHFNTSRRYALAFLEHLDAVGVTKRDDDFRQLKI